MLSKRDISIGLVLAFTLISPSKAGAAVTLPVDSPFLYNFNTNGTLFESRTLEDSSSPYFWLKSGAKLVIQDGVGKTVQGPLATGDEWQTVYKKVNPIDSASGFYPQNTFTIITKSLWNNFTQELSFKINKANITDSQNRDGYSGVFTLSRYKDDNNFYISGIRMDGLAVVKKRINGIYYTLGTAQVFGTKGTYNRATNPNLLPTNVAMRMKSEVKDTPNGDTSITLWIDKDNSGTWTEVLTVVDKAGVYGNSLVHKGRAAAGLHSDFLDISFDDYKLTEL